MAKITKTFEKLTRNHELQVLEISATVNSHDEAAELGYQDFEVNLFINHKFITDLSPVLDQTPVFTDMIDSVDWVSVYQEQMEAKKEYNETEY